MKDNILLETEFFSIKSPCKPHVPFKDGGHIFIEVNDPTISERTQLSKEAAIECMWLTMVAGRAFTDTLIDEGIPIYRLNYQDNGNWAFLRGETPRMHIHIYGRSREEKSQQYGEALYFPSPSNPCYATFMPIDSTILMKLTKKITEVAESAEYSWFKPKVFKVSNMKN